MQTIPLVNLSSQYARLKSEIDAAFAAVISANAFIQGEFAERFESEFVAAIGSRHGIGCANGTAAIALALEALDIGRGDEVITVPNTFFATVEAIIQVGAVPVFVDVDPATQCIDPQLIEAAITPKTRAIIPVHLFGNVCAMAPIMEIAARHGLKVIEDAAQAHLALYQGRCAGTFGDAATFSFYPGKNLGAYGDAGFVVARDAGVAKRVRKLANHGRSGKYEHDMIGYNQRMDGLQAAVLSVKLKYLPAWTETRRHNAAAYREAIRSQVTYAQPTAEALPAYHLFVVEVERRDAVLKHLNSRGIGAGIHYPLPLHLQPALAHLGGRAGMFPVTERLAQRIISLPMCAELTREQIVEVARTFDEAVGA